MAVGNNLSKYLSCAVSSVSGPFGSKLVTLLVITSSIYIGKDTF